MNITEQDLMVGDWVQYGDIHPIKTRVLGINSVDKGKHWHIDAEPENPNGVRVVPMNAVEPIPLTAEILEKNGFKKSDVKDSTDWSYYKTDKTGKGMYCIFYSVDDGMFLEIASYKSYIGEYHRMGVRYVHELQHALHLCGIDKEIKL